MEPDKIEKEKKALELEKMQVSTLRSGNSKAIITTLDKIRKTGQISILPEIFELMLITKDENIVKTCNAVLCDLNVKEVTPLLVSAIQDKKYQSIRNLLLSACWQNGLDYHKDVLVFANILLKDDYATAIEAFTVIENSIGDMDDSAIIKLTQTLKQGFDSLEEQKKPLVSEIINSIKNY